MSYLPGDEGGKAISDILFGDVNPSGKLPFTYPRYTGSLIPYDHKFSEKLDKNFTENGYNPQYPFGHGLSFSNFIYSDLSLSSQTISPVDTLVVKVKVKNTSNLSGKEVIQLYISDTYASITPSVKKLIAFNKQFIEKGKEITVVFKITKDDLTFVDKNNISIYEEGDFEIYISNLTNKFILKK